MDSEKFEINKIFPAVYTASSIRPKLVEVPSMRTLAVSGEGEITGPRYHDSVAALHAVAFGLKNLPSGGMNIEGYMNFNVYALECLWSSKSGGNFEPSSRDEMLWELCVVVPGFVTPALVKIVQHDLQQKDENSRIAEVHVSTLQEKKAAQLLHVGSYDNTQEKFERLQNYIKRSGFRAASRFHEIYLNSPSDTTSSHLKTILRQPVVKLG